MTRLQSIILASSLAFFCLLYFGLSPKPKNIASIERKRAIETEVTDINNLIRDVQSSLTSEQRSYLITLEKEIELSEDEVKKINLLKRLSGKWFEYKQPHIAGFYAEKVAEIENNIEAWGITGTTYAATFKSDKEKKVKDFAFSKAATAFENAISLDPNAIQPKVNLALCYVEYPPKDNPMKGILMLIDLDKQYPDNVLILTNLGRLGMQTGQYDKAIGRLKRVLELEPENRKANCLLAQLFSEKGEQDKAKVYLEKCN
jgi:tetratricopeptide (TPR) repeat protein